MGTPKAPQFALPPMVVAPGYTQQVLDTGNELLQKLGMEAYTPRQNMFLPEPGSNGFFGRHPGLSRAIEGAMLAGAMFPETSPTAGAGENITAAMRSLLGMAQAKRDWQMQQASVPFMLADKMMDYRGRMLDMQGKYVDLASKFLPKFETVPDVGVVRINPWQGTAAPAFTMWDAMGAGNGQAPAGAGMSPVGAPGGVVPGAPVTAAPNVGNMGTGIPMPDMAKMFDPFAPPQSQGTRDFSAPAGGSNMTTSPTTGATVAKDPMSVRKGWARQYMTSAVPDANKFEVAALEDAADTAVSLPSPKMAMDYMQNARDQINKSREQGFARANLYWRAKEVGLSQQRLNAEGQRDMFSYGINTVTGQPLTQANAPAGAVIAADGRVVGKDFQGNITPSQPVQQMGEYANTIIPHINNLVGDGSEKNPGLIAKLAANGKLDYFARNWNDIKAGRLKMNDPDYQQLATDLAMLQTGEMKAHVGASGSQELMHHFENLNNPTMPPEALRNSLLAIRDWMGNYRNAGTIPTTSGSYVGGQFIPNPMLIPGVPVAPPAPAPAPRNNGRKAAPAKSPNHRGTFNPVTGQVE